ncbi:choline kinase [Treponema sp. R8-4-B8]
MRNIESDLKNEIMRVFKINEKEIKKIKKLIASNIVYSFIVKNQKYIIKKLNDTSIINWEREKAAYNSLKPLNITDEIVSFNNGVKIAKFINDTKKLSCSESDTIETLDLIRKIHESGISIKFDYNFIKIIDKFISRCNKETKELIELKKNFVVISRIQLLVDKLNIPKVLCHGDACAVSNILRLSDGSIKIIDWEQSGMADPFLDIAIMALHQGFDNIDPVWCLHQYLKRIPEKQEYLRLFSYLALDSYVKMAWCVYENPGDYEYFLNSAVKYGGLVLNFYKV